MNVVVNKVKRELPTFIEGYGVVRPYMGPFANNPSGSKARQIIASSRPGQSKMIASIREAINKSGLKDGMTISFHHHLRNGDYILNLVVQEIADLGIKDITICASSLTKAHDGLIDYVKKGVITGLHTSGLRGRLAEEQAKNNILGNPVVFRTHGGRARAIEAGEVKIDVAFIGASACDPMGNMNGQEGKSAFGAMGYPMVDAKYADVVVAITDNLMDFPLKSVSIPMTLVDYVVELESIGDPSLIATGATRVTENPLELLIAKNAANVLIASGLVKDGFSFQAGSGGSSLAVCKFLREYLEENNIRGSFASGGITGYLVELLEAKLFNTLIDAQTFDELGIQSLKRNTNHIEMSAGTYANPYNKSCVAHQLDIMILSATEIDVDFNINSVTGSNGMIMGAQGGAPDTAAGSKLTVVVAPTMRKRIPIVVKSVTNVVTPGDTIDVLVTERGIAVNPLRLDIIEKLDIHGIETVSIEELRLQVEKLTGVPKSISYDDEIIGVIEYRDGTVMDVIRKVKA